MTRLISIPFIAEMIVAISATKISLYLGTSPLPLPPSPQQFGIWAVLHEVRSEYAELLTTAFLLVNGPGKWSLDALLQRERSPRLAPSQMQNIYPAPAAR
jgi:putative oxidoreductase